MDRTSPTNGRHVADDFAETVRLTPEGVADSLTLLRRRAVPFADAALASRADLLLLPFLRGLPMADGRVGRLQQALALATGRLPRDYQIVFRHVFLKPMHHGVDERRKAALAELQEHESLKERETIGTIKGIETRMLPILADVLLDPEFEREMDDKHPKPINEASGSPSSASPAIQLLSSTVSVDIDDKDYRKAVIRRRVCLEALVPDQLVAAIRYHTRTSNPMPVDGSVIMLSEGHTYLDTLPDRQDGAVADWLLHFIHLGSRKEPGDCVEIEMQVELFDEARADPHPNLTFTVDHSNVRDIDLSIRLPEAKRTKATAEYRIVKSPHSNSKIVKRKRLTADEDGWVKAELSDLRVGFQYGIFFPDFNLYK